jgi:ubiquinone/menaquinone biosynthesis C-methylase UbiE
MSAAAKTQTPYLFGYSEEESQRLQKQARLFNPSTRRLLQDAGVGHGMHVLDIGSGLGDVALLAAEVVGPSGAVLGIDNNPSILDSARDRARAAGLHHVSFRPGDIASLELEEVFDAVVGRCILFFLRDPAAVLRTLAGRVRSGGLIAFQEPGNATLQPVAVPPSPLLDQLWQWIMQTYRHAGLDLYMGLHLFPLFAEAGLPVPEMHLDAAVGGGPEWAGYEYMASLIRTLLPRIVQFGIATPEEVGVDTLAERLRAEVVGRQGVVTTWSFITAWARKP